MSKTPPPFLGVLKDIGYTSEPIDMVALENPISTGIGLRNINPAGVPPFEEHAARLAAGYKIPEWHELPYMHRALEVAMHRAQNAIKSHQSEAESEAMRQAS